ncbi:MAG: hypothetical protein QG616_1073, partial [Pseudomonadota bacterium]|nr:hypothetical protein [Pseudomonadota bacterium]
AFVRAELARIDKPHWAEYLAAWHAYKTLAGSRKIHARFACIRPASVYNAAFFAVGA